MKSKTKIGKQVQRKRNSEIVETIILAKRHPKWIKIAEILAGPRSNFININLGELNEKIKEGERIVVSGKVLSQGDLIKKSKVIALNFSEPAKDKLLKQKIETNSILEEIKKNPDAKGIRILTK